MRRKELVVLIIDDNPEDQETYQRFLNQDIEVEYQYIVVDSGEEGLMVLRSTIVDVGCVLLDYNLPGIDGIDVLKEISAINRVPVIFLTGYGSEMVAVSALKSCATDYLKKNGLTAELLIKTVKYSIEKMDEDRVLAEQNSFLKTLSNKIPSPKSQNVDISVLEILPSVMCDTIRICDKLNNLLTNGVKYNDKSEKRFEIGCIKSKDKNKEK